MSDFSSRLRPSDPSTQSTLAQERSKSNLPVAELTRHLLSHDGFLERQCRILPIITAEPLFSKQHQLHMARSERYKLGLARAKQLRRIGTQHSWTMADYNMAEYLIDEMSPYHLQMSMFITTIREQGNEEQRAYWLPLIEHWKVLGAYAQTEMGHGSNVRGIECRAIYDVARRQFVLHSPTLTASKWWNGSMGRTATHAIVVAQVMLPKNRPTGVQTIASKDETELLSVGPHPFVVQIRDLHTHRPLPGVIVGDIGPKYGYTSMDNGYLLFDSVRIPHSAFLSRYSTIDPATGAYSKPENSAVVYGSLTSVRAHIIMHARLVLARAVTIAIRYTAVRRQFTEPDKARSPAAASSSSSPATPAHSDRSLELPVLTYPTVQYRLLPLLATIYALHYTGLYISNLYADSRTRIERSQDYSLLSALHAQSSALKSQCTEYAANGIETCRRACGGHGFGGYSGFIALNADYLSKVTVEGDNWMITLQAARWLLKRCDYVAKAVQRVDRDTRRTATAVRTDDNNNDKNNKDNDGEWIDVEIAKIMALQRAGTRVRTIHPVLKTSRAIVQAFERRAAAMAIDVWRKMRAGKSERAVQVEMHHLSNAFAQALLVRSFWRALQNEGGQERVPKGARETLHTLFRLYSLSTLQAHGLSFLTLTPPLVTLADLAKIPEVSQELMAELRPHAVALVDAWAIPDYVLDSALGNSQGEVYERMWDWAHRQNPLNQVTVDPWYESEQVVQGEGRYVAPWLMDEEDERAKL